MVPTVERGFADALFCSMAIVGDNPETCSTAGLSSCPRNCRAYADSVSTYRRCPSAYSVSNAKLDFPEPLGPVNTTNFRFGISM